MAFKNSEKAFLEPYTFRPSEHRSVGRLVRAFSEIEGITRLRLYNMLELDLAEGATVMGHYSLRQILSKLEQIARLNRDPEKDAIIQLRQNLLAGLTLRNIVAHGFLAGLNRKTGEIVFYINETTMFENGEETGIEMKARGVLSEDIQQTALRAERQLEKLEENWGPLAQDILPKDAPFQRKLD